MKNIDKLNINFEKDKTPPRKDLEALHDKINQCVRAINLMHGHYEAGDLPVRVNWDEEDKKERRRLIEVASGEPKIFYFSEINLAVLESGRYHVEKHRAVMTEIRIGIDVTEEFWDFADNIDGEYKTAYLVDEEECKIFNAKIKFAQHRDVYYMKPNEILFLSEYDQLYARAIKK